MIDTFTGCLNSLTIHSNRVKVKTGIPYQRYITSLAREKGTTNMSREETLRKITGASRLANALKDPFPSFDVHVVTDTRMRRNLRDPNKPRPFVAI